MGYRRKNSKWVKLREKYQWRKQFRATDLSTPTGANTTGPNLQKGAIKRCTEGGSFRSARGNATTSGLSLSNGSK